MSFVKTPLEKIKESPEYTTQFGSWIKEKFNTKGLIKKELHNSLVLSYVQKNAMAIPMSLEQLSDLFFLKKDLKKTFEINSKFFKEKDSSKLAEETSDVEMTMESMSDDPIVSNNTDNGVSKQTVVNIFNKAQEVLNTIGDVRNMNDEQLFDLAEKFDEVCEKAAELYIKNLAATPNLDLNIALINLSKISGIQIPTFHHNEVYAIQYMLDLIEENNLETAKKLLIRDINRKDGNNIIKSFQNIVAQAFTPELRVKQGRPKKNG